MKREVSMPEFLLGGEQPKVQGCTLITGVSGSGKNWFADQLKLKGSDVVYLDSISTKIENKWVTDLKLLRRASIVIGWSDNMGAVAEALRDNYEPGTKLTMIWIQPDPQLFRDANAAKAHDAEKTLSAWAVDWKAKSTWSESMVKKWLVNKLSLVTDLVKPEELIIIRNTATSPVKSGWHERPLLNPAPVGPNFTLSELGDYYGYTVKGADNLNVYFKYTGNREEFWDVGMVKVGDNYQTRQPDSDVRSIDIGLATPPKGWAPLTGTISDPAVRLAVATALADLKKYLSA